MRKEEAIKKINQIGQAGWIIALIVKIILFIAAGVLVVGIIATAMIPKGFITVQGAGNGELVVDLEKIGETVTDEAAARKSTNCTPKASAPI